LGHGFVIVALASSAACCHCRAAGFLGGPPVLAGMALDRWMPTALLR